MSTKSKMSEGIVLGLYGPNALGVVRSLGYEDIPVVGFHIKDKFPHASYSKYIKEKYLVDNEEELFEKLIEYGRRQDKKGVIFATGDRYVLFCQDYAEELLNYYHVPLVPGKNLRELLDKGENLKLGKQAGFKVPKSQYLSEELWLEGKLIVKPITSIGTSKKDIKIFESKRELEKAKEDLLERYKDMVVMEYIEGGVKENIEIHCYNSSQGPLIAGMVRKLRALKNCVPGAIGSLIESIWIEELEKPARTLTKLLSFNGALDINLKQERDSSNYYFTEVNFRTSSNLLLDTHAGLNLPAIIYYDQNGEDISNLISKKREMGKKILIESVEMAGSEGKEEIKEINVLVFFDIDDPEPLYKSWESGNLIFSL